MDTLKPTAGAEGPEDGLVFCASSAPAVSANQASRVEVLTLPVYGYVERRLRRAREFEQGFPDGSAHHFDALQIRAARAQRFG